MKSIALALGAATLIAMPVAAESCSYSKVQSASQTAETARYVAHHAEEKADIVDTAAAAGSFTTQLAAAEAAGLVEALKGEGPLTVFAPTDEAFAALPEGTVESLLLPENKDQLAGILKYHVIAGAKVKAADLAGATTTAETLNGEVAIDGTDGVKVNDATVITADVMASNGVIHVIDTVLIPAS
ncbi:MAG: fasciclin domain-containing protein [Pseudomonadota bacterium]